MRKPKRTLMRASLSGDGRRGIALIASKNRQSIPRRRTFWRNHFLRIINIVKTLAMMSLALREHHEHAGDSDCHGGNFVALDRQGPNPANMLTLGQRRQALALERQRRRRGDDVCPTLFRRRLATSHDDANPTSGDDVGSTLFRRRLATSQYDAKPTSGDDVGSTLFRRRLATSQYDAKPTLGDDVGSTLFPRR